MRNAIEYGHEQILLFEKVFDIVRLVDPVRKKVIYSRGYEEISGIIPCYSFNGDNEECKDCISAEALKSHNTFTKILNYADKMYLVLAVPQLTDGQLLALELIKDITDNLVFETVAQGQGHELRNIVHDLNTLILKDDLTGLYNRRYIDQMLPEEIARCTKKHPLSVAMMDIDIFKCINDTYGHNAGDIVIRKVGQLLSKLIRDDVDWAARYGGDEFLVCLANTDSKIAFRVLERIRKAIEKKKIKADDKEIHVTGSFGLCTVKDNELTAVDLIKYADNKLYQAKNNGRNTIVT